MTVAAELLAAMATDTRVTAVATTTTPMTPTITTTILRTLHRRNYGKTIIAATILSRRG